MNGRGRPPRSPGRGGGQDPDRDALLSDEEVQRRINLEGGGTPVPPPPEHRFRDPQPTVAGHPASPRSPFGGAAAELRSTRAARRAAEPAPDQGPSPAPPPPAAADAAEDAAGSAALAAPVVAVERRRASEDERRRQLWRDSATILIGVVLALLLGQAVFPPATSGPIGSPTPLPSSIDIGSFGPPVSLPPGQTLGPIVDPSIGIDRTPTPIPVITMGPTPTATPTAHPSASPSKKPSPKPSAKPTAAPTSTEPPATEAPTPTPPPSVSISCETPVALTVTCTRSASYIEANSEVWNMGGDGVLVAGGNGSNSITWTYTASGSYNASITVTGLNGDTASDSTTVTV